MVKEAGLFYEKLYEEQVGTTKEEIMEYCEVLRGSLRSEEAEAILNVVTEEEVEGNLRRMPKNKTPGEDGLR